VGLVHALPVGDVVAAVKSGRVEAAESWSAILYHPERGLRHGAQLDRATIDVPGHCEGGLSGD